MHSPVPIDDSFADQKVHVEATGGMLVGAVLGLALRVNGQGQR